MAFFRVYYLILKASSLSFNPHTTVAPSFVLSPPGTYRIYLELETRNLRDDPSDGRGVGSRGEISRLYVVVLRYLTKVQQTSTNAFELPFKITGSLNMCRVRSIKHPIRLLYCVGWSRENSELWSRLSGRSKWLTSWSTMWISLSC